VPLFGLALSVDKFHQLAHRLKAAGVKFAIGPHLSFVGWPGEQVGSCRAAAGQRRRRRRRIAQPLPMMRLHAMVALAAACVLQLSVPERCSSDAGRRRPGTCTSRPGWDLPAALQSVGLHRNAACLRPAHLPRAVDDVLLRSERQRPRAQGDDDPEKLFAKYVGAAAARCSRTHGQLTRGPAAEMSPLHDRWDDRRMAHLLRRHPRRISTRAQAASLVMMGYTFLFHKTAKL
jgi:hypothetical protein